MVANMATFDIERFKMQRSKSYYQILQKIGKEMLEEIKAGGDHYMEIMKCASSFWINFHWYI